MKATYKKEGKVWELILTDEEAEVIDEKFSWEGREVVIESELCGKERTHRLTGPDATHTIRDLKLLLIKEGVWTPSKEAIRTTRESD